ncbi:MAG: transcription elongation factor GreB, partial [Luminiphilus sp.]
MPRYRPPRPRGSPYITPEGEAALRAELHELWKVERPVVTAA